MRIKYYSVASKDIKRSSGWLKKMFLLTLLLIIPVFGPIVVFGYLYGWARDIARGIQSPLPERIFGNKDGRLYGRGFNISIFTFILLVALWFVNSFFGFFFKVNTNVAGVESGEALALLTNAFNPIIFILFVIMAFAVILFFWVGSMRVSIHDRISAGFQFSKMWTMIKKDFPGLLRIFGMFLLISLIIFFIAAVLMLLSVLLAVAIYPFVGDILPYKVISMDKDSILGPLQWMAAVMSYFFIILVIASLVFLVFSYFLGVMGMWLAALVVRALGYWAQPFYSPVQQEAAQELHDEQFTQPSLQQEEEGDGCRKRSATSEETL